MSTISQCGWSRHLLMRTDSGQFLLPYDALRTAANPDRCPCQLAGGVLSSGPSTFSPCAAVGPCRDLTAAVGIPARRGIMTGFVVSQYIRPRSEEHTSELQSL